MAEHEIAGLGIASAAAQPMSWKQNAAPKGGAMSLNSVRKNGAGEAIRTPDPNLGKVVLYP